jgi:hypothetical protein
MHVRSLCRSVGGTAIPWPRCHCFLVAPPLVVVVLPLLLLLLVRPAVVLAIARLEPGLFDLHPQAALSTRKHPQAPTITLTDQTGFFPFQHVRTMVSTASLSASLAVLEKVLSGRSVFFTGSAGTGKSYLLKKVLAALPKEGLNVTASTGVAACIIGGTTLHAFAGFSPGSGRLPRKREQWISARRLVIDEISMVDGDWFDELERCARTIRGIDKYVRCDRSKTINFERFYQRSRSCFFFSFTRARSHVSTCAELTMCELANCRQSLSEECFWLHSFGIRALKPRISLCANQGISRLASLCTTVSDQPWGLMPVEYCDSVGPSRNHPLAMARQATYVFLQIVE